jgi:arginine utilization regulatory protein
MNIDPETALKNGLIRPDLFYRLAVVLLELPPLRELRDDILDLGNYFINQHNCKTDTQIKKISDEVCGLFSSYRWPGNIRELKNSIDHALTVANHDEDTICIGHLPPHIAKTQNVTDNIALSGIKSFDETISEISEKIILEAFHDNKKSINQTAKRLKMSSPRLYYRLKKLNLVPNKKN